MEKIKFNQHQSVFKVGELPDKMYLLVKGSVGIFLPTNRSNDPNFIIQENELFGEMGLFIEEHRTANLVTRTPCEFGRISFQDFHAIRQQTRMCCMC